jgi:hypothetical protein
LRISAKDYFLPPFTPNVSREAEPHRWVIESIETPGAMIVFRRDLSGLDQITTDPEEIVGGGGGGGGVGEGG